MAFDPVNVLSTMAFPDAWLQEIRAISPRLRVTQHTAAAAAEIPESIWRETDVLYTGSAFPELALAPRLKWVQLDTSGVDHVRTTGLWDTAVEITTLNGVAPSNMAEFALMMMLATSRRLSLMVELQARREWPTYQQRWDWFMPNELRGATVGIVGYGSIGREIGRLAHAFGMRVLAMRRTGGGTRDTFRIPALVQSTNPEPDRVYLPDQIDEMLPACDYVILIVPYTDESHHLIDERALRTMKPTSVLINLARGGVVDEDALIQALREEWIAGAALDVFAEEPLPAESVLWAMPNVLISPHVAGFTPHYLERVQGVFAENLRRRLDGAPLLNLVDRTHGY